MTGSSTVDVQVSTPPPIRAANPTRGRWLLAGAAFLLQLAIGAVYAWSVFAKALQNKHSTFALGNEQAALPFSVTIGMIFLGTFLGGRIQDVKGPRIVALTGGIIYSGGVLLAGLASGRDQYWLLITAYGVIAGFGLGMAWIVPVTMLQKWFPDKRGLISGIAVGGVGFGAVVTSPVAQRLVDLYPRVPTRAFIWLGLGYLAMVLIGGLQFRNPPPGYQVPGYTPAAGNAAGPSERDYSPAGALRTPQWYLLTTILTLNVTAGIGLIAVSAVAAHDIAGYGVASAATFTGAMGFFNGAGRIFWGWLSEQVGRMTVYATMFGIQTVCFVVLPYATAPAQFAMLVAAVNLCFGGGFGALPATAGDYFGLRHAGAIFGLMIVGWSIGGILGPLLVASLIAHWGYVVAFTTVGVLMFASIVLPLITRPPAVRATAQTVWVWPGLTDTHYEWAVSPPGDGQRDGQQDVRHQGPQATPGLPAVSAGHVASHNGARAGAHVDVQLAEMAMGDQVVQPGVAVDTRPAELTGAEWEELSALRRENRRLRDEIENLKRSAGFFVKTP